MTRNTLSQVLVKGQRLAYAAILLLGLALSIGPVQVAQAAIIVVDTNLDDASINNNCSLREAIRSANLNTSVDDCTAGAAGLDTIQVPAATIVLTIAGQGSSAGDLDITEDLEITGDLPGAIIDGSNASFDDRVFDVNNGANATMTNLTVTGADVVGESGGGIQVEANGTLTLQDSTVSNNTANNGGGIANFGTLTLNSSTVSGNTAIISGGGIHNPGTITATSITLGSNTAGDAGGGVNNTGIMTVNSSTINSNSTVNGGGGISNLGTITVTSSTIASNQSSDLGGGIISDTASTTNSITNSTIQGNTANRHGGGIANLSGTLALDIVTIASNTADFNADTVGNGGGIHNTGAMTVIGGTIDSNSAGDSGGGVNNTGTMTVANGTIESNNTGNVGGGISNLGTITVTSSTIAFNNAGSDGGGMNSDSAITSNSITNSTIHGNSADRHGGGISNTTGTLTLNNTTVAGNTADADASETGNGGGIAAIGGVVNFGNTLIGLNSDSSPTSTVGPDCTGSSTSLISLDYNLVQNIATCDFTVMPNDITGSDALLGPLQDNGGDTLTRALLNGSPAIDAGNPAAPGGSPACEAADQRGVARPQGAACDIGAYEAQQVSFSTAAQTVAESVGTVSVTVNLTAASELTVTVPYTVSGTATGGGTDHDLANGNITIDPGDLTGSVSFSVTDDSLIETNETVVVTMGTPTNAVQGATTVQTITIQDNDPQVNFTTAAQTVAESVGNVTVTASLSTARSDGLNVTVPYTVSGTATGGGTDHNLANGNITITAGNLTGSKTFTVTNDLLDESNETVIVTMGTPTNAFAGTITVQTITITDDDGPRIFLPIVMNNAP